MIRRLRVVLDCVMLLLSFVQMGGNLLFQADIIHEICGTVLFIVWAAHVMLNRRWYAALFRGRFTAYRVMQTGINLCILICAVFLMISGIMLSNHVFVFLHIENGASFARTVHLLASHWYFVCMSLHIGMHAGMMIPHTKAALWAVRASTAAACVYGVYAFILRGIWKYLLYQQPFFYLDLGRGYALFFIDYVCIMILAAAVSHRIAVAFSGFAV